MEKSNTKGDGVFMKKIIMLVILVMTVFSCELLDPSGWERARRKDAERGVKCYKYPSGNVYCEDKDGNNY
ncbi:hypothetical protein [Leptotrichia wadei]|jgi:hypothetical protein|uniref:hypothetical protein n=1 Tax=Leptotrichia wadei TaxID=157687 RepID=UPI0028E89280|nr:hypothetical protein [Leptotrichia wadei]